MEKLNGQSSSSYLATVVTKIHIHTGLNQKRDYLKSNPTEHGKLVNTKSAMTYD